MLSENEKDKLRSLVFDELKDDFDLFDFNSEIDSSLSYQENKTILLDKIDKFVEKKINKDTIKENEIKAKLMNMNHRTKGNFWNNIKDHIKVLVCVSETGGGKTAFCFKHLQIYDKPIYIYKHPNRELIKAIGYRNIDSLSQMGRLTDAVVYFDEPQLSFPRNDKTSNDTFLLLCSLARQNNLTLIFSTSDTRWINKGLESYVSHWVIKTIDINLVKNGSNIKKIVKSTMPLAQDELLLNVNEYLFYSSRDNHFNGIHTFEKPSYYDDKFSKAYRSNATF